MSIQIESRGFEHNNQPNIQVFEKTDSALIPRKIESRGIFLAPQGRAQVTASLGEYQTSRTFKTLSSEDKIVIELKTLNQIERLINWIFGAVFSPIHISTEKVDTQSMAIGRSAASTQSSSVIEPGHAGLKSSFPKGKKGRVKTSETTETPMEATRFVTFVSARNLSDTAVDRVNVYMEGRDDSILGTDFDGINYSGEPVPTFRSSLGGTKPYLITAYVKKDGKTFSGQMKVKEKCTVDIDIEKTQIVMRRYQGMISYYGDRKIPETAITFTECPSVPMIGGHPAI